MVRTWVVVASLVLSSPAVADPWDGKTPRAVSSDLAGPPPELGDPQAKIALPALPPFELPVAPAGTVGVRELMVNGRSLLNTDVKVSGYVIWIYDCLSAVRKPGQSMAQAQKMIDYDPTLCERAKFYLGDTKTTPPEQGLWVVDVPRVFNKLEVERIKKSDRATFPDRCEPDKKRKHNLCVDVAVGKYVTLSGKFALASPHSERNSDGLIVFSAVAPGTAPATVAMKAVVAPAAKKTAAITATAVVTAPATEAIREESLRHSNEGTRAYAMRDFGLAITKYREAVKAWDSNHVAWYGMAGAEIGRSDWKAANTAVAKAFEIAPTQPMYAMVLGYTHYELRFAEARARSPGADVSTVDQSRAEQYLRHALTLEPKLWRAHYYLGRISRDAGRAKDAAAAFTAALASGPTLSGPWIALTELYRKWQYPDLALAVAEQGTQRVPGAEATDVWYALGMAYDDKRNDAAAIKAFTKALDADPKNVKATFQRGQAYARSKKTKKQAKADLEAFLAAAPADLEFAKQQANKMLLDLGAK